MAVHEMRIYMRLEINDRVEKLGNWYHSEWGDRLLISMGLPRWMTASRLKIVRDVLCALLVGLLFTRAFMFGLDDYYYPLVMIAALYSLLSPIEQFPSLFTMFVSPLFQRIHNYRVGRETAVLLQLLRNEANEKQERSVLSIIRQFQGYFKILQPDLLMLEHEWKNRKLALKHFMERYPENQEVDLICSVLEKLDEIGYEEAEKTLAENEKTLSEKQTASYKARQKDINSLLTLVNLSGVAAAALWGVLALFLWAYAFDINY